MHLVFRALPAGLLLLVACSGSTSSTSSSSGGSSSGDPTPVATASCQSRCEAKGTTCGAAPADATAQCQTAVCNASLTEGQVKCFETATCDAIEKTTSFTALCPPPSSGSSGSSGTSGTSGSSGGGGTFSCNDSSCTAATQYCGLTYDSTAGAWKESACKAIPAACVGKDLCGGCLKDNSGCPTSGTLNLKCGSDNGNTSFGCE